MGVQNFFDLKTIIVFFLFLIIPRIEKKMIHNKFFCNFWVNRKEAKNIFFIAFKWFLVLAKFEIEFVKTVKTSRILDILASFICEIFRILSWNKFSFSLIFQWQIFWPSYFENFYFKFHKFASKSCWKYTKRTLKFKNNKKNVSFLIFFVFWDELNKKTLEITRILK